MKRSGKQITATLLAALVTAACTVRPLYAPLPGTPESRTETRQSSIYIEPVKKRAAVVTRNELIFLLNGGSGQPSDAKYTLTLKSEQTTSNLFVEQLTSRDGEPTARTVHMIGSYELRNSADNALISNRKTSVSASFDVSRQEFSVARALRDAENRAARQLAEQLRGFLVADLARLNSQ